MRLEEALDQVEHVENSLKKRFACAHCGKTWVEIVGCFFGTIEGENVFFKLGEESETCQNCKFKSRSCPVCNSKDVYEINFPTYFQEAPLSFNRIRVVSKTTQQ